MENKLFCDYFDEWIEVYKVGAVRDVTVQKYRMSSKWLRKLAPELKCKEVTRQQYQKIINEYAKEHEKITTRDFHRNLKAAVLDAVDEGYVEKDPTRRVIVKGKMPSKKRPKYLNQYELHAVLKDLNLGKEPDMDWLILLVAKTGLRFSEALGLTPKDFDFEKQTLASVKRGITKGTADSHQRRINHRYERYRSTLGHPYSLRH